jgi:hypothetical protein
MLSNKGRQDSAVLKRGEHSSRQHIRILAGLLLHRRMSRVQLSSSLHLWTEDLQYYLQLQTLIR